MQQLQMALCRTSVHKDHRLAIRVARLFVVDLSGWMDGWMDTNVGCLLYSRSNTTAELGCHMLLCTVCTSDTFRNPVL